MLLAFGNGTLTGQNKAGCPIAVWVGIVHSLPEIIQALYTLPPVSARAAFDSACRGGLCACGHVQPRRYNDDKGGVLKNEFMLTGLFQVLAIGARQAFTQLLGGGARQQTVLRGRAGLCGV